ncbi:hypothetical protein CEXT_740951 [Caerostris extrusa]|uniref:Uncharacterized protein n=1 Tax=Caerostris extrusa TaxID=172846 RepID=A0AAV4XP16_CAEEX|nr:hypothetical protein CEXT_740951 [Caerostris extrusa]
MVNTIPVHSAMAITIPENLTMAIIFPIDTMVTTFPAYSTMAPIYSTVLHFPHILKRPLQLRRIPHIPPFQHILQWPIIFQHILQWPLQILQTPL